MIDFTQELYDDSTDTGGIAYMRETLGDFLDSIQEIDKKNLTVEKINVILIECGTEPIKE